VTKTAVLPVAGEGQLAIDWADRASFERTHSTLGLAENILPKDGLRNTLLLYWPDTERVSNHALNSKTGSSHLHWGVQNPDQR
jgi:hypothetical protein